MANTPVNNVVQRSTDNFEQTEVYQADLVWGALPAADTLVSVDAMNEPQAWGQIADLGELA